MPPKRKRAYFEAEERAVLECLIDLFVKRGIAPAMPELSGKKMANVASIFLAVGSDGVTPWGVELSRAMLEASTAARQESGEDPLTLGSFLAHVVAPLTQRSAVGDAAAFRVLAAEHGLEVPVVRTTRSNAWGSPSSLSSPTRPSPAAGAPVSPSTEMLVLSTRRACDDEQHCTVVSVALSEMRDLAPLGRHPSK
jgi:hypothetical protein